IMSEHARITRDRREFLSDAFCGFGALAFADLIARSASATTLSSNPLSPKQPQMPDKAKAKSVIFLFMAGGPSHLDTFDPKPLLTKLDGQPRPAGLGGAQCQFIQRDA